MGWLSCPCWPAGQAGRACRPAALVAQLLCAPMRHLLSCVQHPCSHTHTPHPTHPTPHTHLTVEWRERKGFTGGMEMNVTVLTTGFWPTYKVRRLNNIGGGAKGRARWASER